MTHRKNTRCVHSSAKGERIPGIRNEITIFLRATRVGYAQFTPPARLDKTVLSMSCLARLCELPLGTLHYSIEIYHHQFQKARPAGPCCYSRLR